MEDKHWKPSLPQKIQQLSSIKLIEKKKLLFTQFGWRWVWNQFPASQKAIEDTHQKQKHLLQLYFRDVTATPSLCFISVLIISNQCSWMKIIFVIMIRVSMTSLGKYFSELHKEVLSMPVASQVKTQDCGTYWWLRRGSRNCSSGFRFWNGFFWSTTYVWPDHTRLPLWSLDTNKND